MLVITILTSLFSHNLWANWPLVEYEKTSQLTSLKKIKKISKDQDFINLFNVFEKSEFFQDFVNGKVTCQQFIKRFSRSQEFKKIISHCSDISACEIITLNEWVIFLRSKQIIDDTAGLILRAHINNKMNQLNWLAMKKLDLPQLFVTQSRINRLKSNFDFLELNQYEKFPKRHLKPWGKISQRQSQYLQYNFFQLKVMTDLINRAQKRIQSSKIEIVLTHTENPNDMEKIELSPAEKYRFSYKMLNIELENEKLSQGQLHQTNPSYIDLLSSLIEFNFIDPRITRQLILMPEFKQKDNEKTRLYLQSLWIITKAGLMASPVGLYSILPIIVIESFANKTKLEEQKNAKSLF